MNFETVVSTGWRAGIDCKRAGWRSGQGRGDVWARLYKCGTLQKRCGQDGRGTARSSSGRGDCNSYNTTVLSLRWVWQEAN